MMKIRTSLFLYIIFFAVFSAFSAEKADTGFITHEQWTKYSKKYNYSEKFKPEKEKDAPVFKQRKRKEYNYSESFKMVIYIIVIAIFAILIFFLLRSIIKNSGGKIKNRGPAYNTLYIENINEIDLDDILQNHIKNKEFKEAFRFKYLILLRKLNNLKLILWKKDKPNGIYLNEMYGKTGYEIFFNITLEFDRVWYGDKYIDESYFNQINNMFDNFDQLFLTSEQ